MTITLRREDWDYIQETLKLQKNHIEFNCPHEAEQLCSCAKSERELWNKSLQYLHHALTIQPLSVPGREEVNQKGEIK